MSELERAAALALTALREIEFVTPLLPRGTGCANCGFNERHERGCIVGDAVAALEALGVEVIPDGSR